MTTTNTNNTKDSSSLRCLGTAAGLLIERGYFILLYDLNSFEPEHIDAISTLRKCTMAPLAKLGDAHFDDSDEACKTLLADGKSSCWRFLSRDDGAEAVTKSIPSRYLPFFAAEVSPIPIQHFFSVVAERFGCEGQVVITALVLLARIVKRAGVPLTQRSAHRMILGAMTVAAKIHHDIAPSVAGVAARFSMDAATVARLELAVLKALNFETFVDPREFTAMAFALRFAVAQTANTGSVTWLKVLPALWMPLAEECSSPLESGAASPHSDRRADSRVAKLLSPEPDSSLYNTVSGISIAESDE